MLIHEAVRFFSAAIMQTAGDANSVEVSGGTAGDKVIEAARPAIDAVSYELIQGNEIWRFAAVFICILAAMIVGKIVQFVLTGAAANARNSGKETVLTMIVDSIAKPVYVMVFAFGLRVAKVFLYFDEKDGIKPEIGAGWAKAVQVIGALAVAYALYRLVDVVEHYLGKLVSKTHTRLDDMLLPLLRKSLRVTIVVFSILFVANVAFGAENIKSVLLGAGVGGLAIALAAQDTIANFFGSITIFADKPFQIDDWVKIGGHFGPVEEVGFRSSRIRTLEGSLVTIPNKEMANTIIENVGARPAIRRTTEITITYDSGYEKVGRAVEIIKEVLAGVPEVNSDPDFLPKVYFSEFDSCSLNIYMTYWFKPPKYWDYMAGNEKINFEILKRFDAEGIEFAFPTQTLYLKKDD